MRNAVGSVIDYSAKFRKQLNTMTIAERDSTIEKLLLDKNELNASYTAMSRDDKIMIV